MTDRGWWAIMHPEVLKKFLDDQEDLLRRLQHWPWRLFYWLRCGWTRKETDAVKEVLREFGR